MSLKIKKDLKVSSIYEYISHLCFILDSLTLICTDAS